MNKAIRITISAKTSANPGHTAKAQPIYIPVSDLAAQELKAAILLADRTDAVPADGVLEARGHESLKAHGKLFGLFNYDVNISVDHEIDIEIVDYPIAPPV